MFNGEIRTKRQINLGGSNNRNRNRNRNRQFNRRVGGTSNSSSNNNGTRPTDKASVLEEARLRREERKIQQLRKESSRRIQSVWRGYSKRKESVAFFLSLCSEDEFHTRNYTWKAMGFILSAPLSVYYFSENGNEPNEMEKIMLVMKKVDKFLHQDEFSPDSKSFASVRIVFAALNLLSITSCQEQTSDSQASSLLLLRIVLTLSNLDEATPFFSMIPSIMPALLNSLQHSISNHPKSTITGALFKLTYRSIMNLNESKLNTCTDEIEYAKACLGASLFCNLDEMTPSFLQKIMDHVVNKNHLQTIDSAEIWTQYNLLQPLTNYLSLPLFLNDDPISSKLKNPISYKAHSKVLTEENITNSYPMLLKQILKHREINLLSNALSFLNINKNKIENKENNFISSCILVQLLHYTMAKNHSLTIAMGISASGSNLGSMTRSPIKSDQSKTDELMNLDSSDDDEDYELFDGSNDNGNGDVDMTDASIDQNANISNIKRRNGYFNNEKSKIRTKEAYLTIPKLDKVMSQHIAFQQEFITSASMKSTLLPLASKLSEGTLLLNTGITILSKSSSPYDIELNALKNMYCSILSKILKGNSINPSLGYLSPLLSAMTLRGRTSLDFMNLLWSFTENQQKLRCTDNTHTRAKEIGENFSSSIVFCDLFLYFLFSKDDDEFLDMYTINENEQKGYLNSILANSVIIWLRDVLQDLYWIKPVTSHQSISCLGLAQEDRIHMLLSGTKLYNSLYERWCRVHKSNLFCEEKTWWFPQHSRIMRKVKDGEQVIVTGDSINIEDDDSVSEGGMHQTARDNEEESTVLASLFRDAKIARLLTGIPQALPFNRRVALFNSLLKASKNKTQSVQTFQDVLNQENSARKLFKIRRDNLFNDAMELLNKEGPNLRARIQIKFVNEHGFEEAGVDGGGVFKEFLEDLVREAIRPNLDVPLFSVSSLETLYPSPGTEHMQKQYAFIGRVLGKAVYESILVEPQFCTPFLNTLLGKQNSLDDLKYLDPEFYRHLKELRKLNEVEIAGLGLSFELTTTFGKSIELLSNGSNIPLTKENSLRYIHLVSHYKLNVEGALQTRAFLRGFRDLVSTPYLRLFSSHELQKLISGDDSIQGIDVKAMKEIVVYSGGYHLSQPIVQWFWEVLEFDFSPEQQRMFLKFMTSCSRQPLLGFAALSPVPCIRQVPLSDNIRDDYGKDAKLPTSSTCMNLLKLPKYDNKKQLKEKLIYAIESGAGFELS